MQGNATVFSNLQEKPSSSSINIFANKGHHSVNLLESKPEKHNASTDLASSEEYASGIKLSKSKAVVYADDKAEYDEIFAVRLLLFRLMSRNVSCKTSRCPFPALWSASSARRLLRIARNSGGSSSSLSLTTRCCSKGDSSRYPPLLLTAGAYRRRLS